MKKLFIASFVLICITTVLSAQSSLNARSSQFSFGVLGGLNMPRLSGGSGNEMSRDYTSRSGEAFGLTVSMNLGSNFGLRADLLYSSEGGKRNGIQAINASSVNPLAPAGTYFYADFNNESILNYLEIPVLLKYTIQVSNSSKLYADFGPCIGFLLNATQKTSGSSIIYADRAKTTIIVPIEQSFEASTDVKSSINHNNFGVTGGIGFAQRAFAGSVFIDLRGAYGLTVIQKDKQNGSSHNGNLLIALGYSFPF
jgi:hypothetical protein